MECVLIGLADHAETRAPAKPSGTLTPDRRRDGKEARSTRPPLNREPKDIAPP